MTERFRAQAFRGLFDRDGEARFENLEFEDCTFTRCGFSLTYDAARRSTARDIRLTNCSVDRIVLGAGIIEDVTVDRLRTTDVLQVWAAAYRHVTLRGPIGRVMLSPLVEPLKATPGQQRAFDEANRRFYASVDWALDVTEADFEEFEPRGVPGHLVRRDPRDSALVTRERAQQGLWRRLDLSGTWWDIALGDLAISTSPSEVLVAPRRSPKYRRLVDGLNLLKDEGIAEPD